ncbi:MAG: hypothetical protein JO091_09170 [Acidobacteriaceae bacterium]|nr:hypothetical protein [Acidobacteriaceae bacterium]
MAFPSEGESFRALRQLLGDATVFLVDTYDTLEGTRLAAGLGPPLWGVRLDSGDLISLSREVRRILDAGGLRDAKIFATNDLDEHRIAELVRSGAPFDAFGVGTQLATSADAPTLGAVYKLVELTRGGELQYAAKFSEQKSTLPGAKQIYRYGDHDVIALYSECNSDFQGMPLVRPVLSRGELVEPLPALEKSRGVAQAGIAALPQELRSLTEQAPYRVEIGAHLIELAETLRQEIQLAR